MSKYKERIAEGLCGKCGKQREPETKSLCKTCCEREKIRVAAKRKESKATGKCQSCNSRPREPNRSRCQQCLASSAATSRRAQRQRKASGLCQSCGKVPPITDKTICRTCSKRMTKVAAARYHERRATGKCNYCEKQPESGKTMCSYHLEQTRKHRESLKLEVFEAYGGAKCSWCPETDILFLEIDHIKGGGNKHMKEIGGSGSNFYSWLRANNYPSGFRVLCRVCNAKAHVENCRAAGYTVATPHVTK